MSVSLDKGGHDLFGRFNPLLIHKTSLDDTKDDGNCGCILVNINGLTKIQNLNRVTNDVKLVMSKG